MTVCQYYQNGFCKYRQQCGKVHISELCPAHSSCQNNECEKRHPRPCRMFAKFRSCKFESCAYSHDYDSRNNNIIDDLKNEVLEIKQSIEKLSETCQKEAKIKTLEEEVKVLKLEIKRLFCFYQKVQQKK